METTGSSEEYWEICFANLSVVFPLCKHSPNVDTGEGIRYGEWLEWVGLPFKLINQITPQAGSPTTSSKPIPTAPTVHNMLLGYYRFDL